MQAKGNEANTNEGKQARMENGEIIKGKRNGNGVHNLGGWKEEDSISMEGK